MAIYLSLQLHLGLFNLIMAIKVEWYQLSGTQLIMAIYRSLQLHLGLFNLIMAIYLGQRP